MESHRKKQTQKYILIPLERAEFNQVKANPESREAYLKAAVILMKQSEYREVIELKVHCYGGTGTVFTLRRTETGIYEHQPGKGLQDRNLEKESEEWIETEQK